MLTSLTASELQGDTITVQCFVVDSPQDTGWLVTPQTGRSESENGTYTIHYIIFYEGGQDFGALTLLNSVNNMQYIDGIQP